MSRQARSSTLLSEAKLFPLFARPGRASLRRNARNKQGSGSVSISNSLSTIFAGRRRGIGQKRIVDMKRLALFAALVFSVFAQLAVLAGSPAVAQGALANGQSQSAAEAVLSAPTPAPSPAPSQGPTIGVFCIEEMTATFCNVVTGPNTNGHGTRSAGSSSTSGSNGGGSTSSIPPCPAQPPFNELCN